MCGWLNPTSFIDKVVEIGCQSMTHEWHQRLSGRDVMTSTKCRFFKLNVMLTNTCSRVEQLYAHWRFNNLVYAICTWIRNLLALYQVGRSSFLSSVHCGVVYFSPDSRLRLATSGCRLRQQFYFGGADVPARLTPSAGCRTSRNSWGTPEKCATRVRRWRETPASTKKVRFPSTVLRRVSILALSWDPGWFLLRQLANWTSVWDIVSRPRWARMRHPFNKGNDIDYTLCLDI